MCLSHWVLMTFGTWNGSRSPLSADHDMKSVATEMRALMVFALRLTLSRDQIRLSISSW